MSKLNELMARWEAEDDLPSEIAVLRDTFEWNDWHEESVYQHTRKVLSHLRCLSLPSPIVEHNRYSELFELAVWLHDIGKPDTIQEVGGITRCPSHEEIGAVKAQTLIGALLPSRTERELVTGIIRYHRVIHHVAATDDWQHPLKELSYRSPSLVMVLLGYAETQTSDLRFTRPQECLDRIRRYGEMSRSLWEAKR